MSTEKTGEPPKGPLSLATRRPQAGSYGKGAARMALEAAAVTRWRGWRGSSFLSGSPPSSGRLNASALAAAGGAFSLSIEA